MRNMIGVRLRLLALVLAPLLVLSVVGAASDPDIDPIDVPDQGTCQTMWQGTSGMAIRTNHPGDVGGNPDGSKIGGTKNWTRNNWADYADNNGDAVNYSGRDYRWWRANGRPDPFDKPGLRFSFHRTSAHRRDQM